MEKIIVSKLPRILKAKKQLEKRLNIKITNRGREIYFDGKPLDEYSAQLVLEAMDFGFSLSSALKIKEEDAILEILNIKDYTKRNDLSRIRARIIGKEGKTINTLRNLTQCDIETNGNSVGIIGEPLLIENAHNAIVSIIQGSKQANVYAFLEKHRVEPVFDLGLKDKK